MMSKELEIDRLILWPIDPDGELELMLLCEEGHEFTYLDVDDLKQIVEFLNRQIKIFEGR